MAINNPSISNYQSFYFQFPTSFVFKVVAGDVYILLENGDTLYYTGNKTSDATPFYIWESSTSTDYYCTAKGLDCEAGDTVYTVVGGAKGEEYDTISSKSDNRQIWNGADVYDRDLSDDSALAGFAWKKGSVILYTKSADVKRGDALYIDAVNVDTAHAPAIDSLTYGFIAKSNPYPMLPKPKSPYSNDWPAEDGEEEYVKAMFYESITFDVSFFARATGATAPADLREAMALFFADIRQGYFSVYDAYTAIGRKDVRYNGFEEESFSTDNTPNTSGYTARAIFTISFKCNAPTAFTQLNNNRIEEI